MATGTHASHAGVLDERRYSGDEDQLDSASVVKVKLSGGDKGLHIGSERKVRVKSYSKFFILKN